MKPVCNQHTKASELAAHYAHQIAGNIILITSLSLPLSLGESFPQEHKPVDELIVLKFCFKSLNISIYPHL
jgi:hypothetical protein